MTMSWGDFRNRCTPPSGGASPCTPSGRGDQDVFFDRIEPLSGPDLFVQPWGYITGEGPLWQSPDIYVVDLSNIPVNARKRHS